jgi:hypothetical protein
MTISLGGLGVGVAVLVVSCTFFSVTFWQAAMWYAIGEFFLLAFPWACLEWETRNRSVRAHNRFVYFTFAVVVVVWVMQWETEGEPFTTWAVLAIIGVGIAAYSVMAYYAVTNFQKWRHGDFK